MLALSAAALASGGGSRGEDVPVVMSRLVLQLGLIVLAARLAGLLVQKFSIPSVLIELSIGIIIGPYLLGKIPLPVAGFENGIFPLVSGTGIPVSNELYAIATIASIIMLFSAGLETDLTLLLRFSLTGLAVGTGGVIVSFGFAALVVMRFFGLPLSDPAVLFLAVACISTSLGIVARILSEKRKMDSPEGVTILASAVIDDMLGIVALTIVTGLAAHAVGAAAGAADANPFLAVGGAIAFWLLFTAIGILFASPLARAIKKFKSVTYISIFSLGLALVLAGVFQMAGLAMIIGAYVVGLSLSKTDLTDTVRDALDVLHGFFVPVFFVVMGMLVNVGAVMSKEVLTLGLVLSLAMVASKIIGCGLPALFFSFNRLGALRIGMGMVPRGEVSFIIASVGLSSGVLGEYGEKMFGAVVLMVLACAVVSPPVVSMLFGSPRKGVKKELQVRHTVSTPVAVPTSELADLLELRVVQAFRSEGFFVHSISLEGHTAYHLRKNDIHITRHAGDAGLEFESDKKDVILVKAIAYETFLRINNVMAGVRDMIKPETMLKELTESQWRADSKFKDALSQYCIIPSLKAGSKREVVEKLVGMLQEHGLIKGPSGAVDAVMEREATMSTGMQHGVAMPHARTDAVEKITLAVGLSKTGIEFDSLDGEPSKIFVLILSPQSTDSPHIQFLANISALLNSEEMREKLLACGSQEEIYKFFMDGLGN